jgi:transcriptional regulator with XRE-family HTH domain
MTAPHSPTVRARRLGSYLRTLREDVGLTFDEVATLTGKHHSTIRRIEKGETKPEFDFVEELLLAYGTDESRRVALLSLAENAWRRGWWQEFGDVLDGTFACLEDDANTIRSWQTDLVPGLLQTEDYSRSLFASGLPSPAASEVEQRVDARSRRRKLLRRTPAPHLHAILGEAVLRQEVGGPEVMAAQLRYLLEVGERDNVTIQVLPYFAGAHAAMAGPFVIFGFEHADDPDVAYTESLSGSTYSESATALGRFRLAWGGIADVALSPDESASMIGALTDER